MIGNLFLSKFILLKTVKDTINYEAIFKDSQLRSIGFISLGSALVILLNNTIKMSSALIMMNVTIFALPMSSTHIMFSGLSGATLFAFRDFHSLGQGVIVQTTWILVEALIWVFTPIISVGLTIAMYKTL